MHYVVPRSPTLWSSRIRDRDGTTRMIRGMHQTHNTRSHNRLAVVLAVASTLVASVIGVGAGQHVGATPPGVNGRISFMRSDADGHWQIWTANPDLTASRQITNGDYDSGWAVWSPDGTRLAFHSPRDDSNHTDAISDIFVMNADGTDVTKLTHSVDWSETPTWSPTGDTIAFSSTNFADPSQQGIYVVRSDGTGMRRVHGTADRHRARLLPRVTVLLARRAQPRLHLDPGGQRGPPWIQG